MGCQISSDQIKAAAQQEVQFLKQMVKNRISDMAMGYIQQPMNNFGGIGNLSGLGLGTMGISGITNNMSSIKNMMTGQFPYIPKNGSDIKTLLKSMGQGIITDTKSLLKSTISGSMSKMILPLNSMVPGNANLAFESVNAFRQNQNILRIPILQRAMPDSLPISPQAMDTLTAAIFCGNAGNLAGVTGAYPNFGTMGSITDKIQTNLSSKLNISAMNSLGSAEGGLLQSGMTSEALAPMSQINQINQIQTKMGDAASNFASELGSVGMSSDGKFQPDSSVFDDGQSGQLDPRIVDNFHLVKEELGKQQEELKSFIDDNKNKIEEVCHDIKTDLSKIDSNWGTA